MSVSLKIVFYKLELIFANALTLCAVLHLNGEIASSTQHQHQHILIFVEMKSEIALCRSSNREIRAVQCRQCHWPDCCCKKHERMAFLLFSLRLRKHSSRAHGGKSCFTWMSNDSASLILDTLCRTPENASKENSNFEEKYFNVGKSSKKWRENGVDGVTDVLSVEGLLSGFSHDAIIILKKSNESSSK